MDRRRHRGHQDSRADARWCRPRAWPDRGRVRIVEAAAPKTLDGYDFSFQLGLDPHRVKDLATLSFVEAKANAALLGPGAIRGSKIL